MRSQPLKPWCRRVGPVTFLVFLTGHVWDPTAAVPPLRAVITDVDGTLMAFATSSRISQRNRKALLAAKEVGCEVMVATGRIPGPWYDALQAEMPEVLGAGVFCNGALILKDHEVLHESVLPKSAVAKIVDCLPAGRVGLKGPRLGALAVIGSHEDGSHHYSELTTDGATWVTSLIQRAGEPVSITTSWKSLLEMKVHKFVMFTDTEKNWAPMDEVVAMLQEKLQRTGVTVLDCGSKQCEILPPGVNKGGVWRSGFVVFTVSRFSHCIFHASTWST